MATTPECEYIGGHTDGFDAECAWCVQAKRVEAGTLHVFKFSRDFQGGKRVCGECRHTYDEGAHAHVAVLKPYTSYVCPVDTGRGHSSVWSGAQNVPELRKPTDDRCICGAQLVEEDREEWRLSWEYVSPFTGDWTPCERVGSKHSTEQQQAGLLSMPDEVRNVKLVKVGD